MITRKEYMANSAELHQPYYAEIAKEAGVVIHADLMRLVYASKDRSFNDLYMAAWDAISINYQRRIDRAMKARGDFWSIAGGVCAAKAQARVQLDEWRKARVAAYDAGEYTMGIPGPTTGGWDKTAWMNFVKFNNSKLTGIDGRSYR